MTKDKFNEELAKKQKITDEQRENLNKLYKEIDNLLREEMIDEQIEKTGKYYSQKMRELEFELQENWNFPKDPLFHTWWNVFSQCRCPKIDNTERFGFDKIIRMDCPIHGER
jgi:predicted chitinase